jgi:hypothetical protein
VVPILYSQNISTVQFQVEHIGCELDICEINQIWNSKQKKKISLTLFYYMWFDDPEQMAHLAVGHSKHPIIFKVMQYTGTGLSTYQRIVVVLLRGIQLTLVQRFYQQYFLIQYCCDNTKKVRTPNAVRRSGTPHVDLPHEKYKFYIHFDLFWCMISYTGTEHTNKKHQITQTSTVYLWPCD